MKKYYVLVKKHMKLNVFFIFVVFNCLLHLLFYMDELRNIEF